MIDCKYLWQVSMGPKMVFKGKTLKTLSTAKDFGLPEFQNQEPAPAVSPPDFSNRSFPSWVSITDRREQKECAAVWQEGRTTLYLSWRKNDPIEMKKEMVLQTKAQN